MFGPLELTDHGNHVEWTDGKRITVMRLPDQADSAAGYPTLHAVLVAEFTSNASYAGPGASAGSCVRFIGSDGAVLAWFGPRRGQSVEVTDRLLTDEALAGLRARGVQVVRKRYASNDRSFYTEHPDPRVSTFSRGFAAHGLAWVTLALLVVVAIVLAVMAATGAFSS